MSKIKTPNTIAPASRGPVTDPSNLPSELAEVAEVVAPVAQPDVTDGAAPDATDNPVEETSSDIMDFNPGSPSCWELQPHPEGVLATHRLTRKVFVGSTAEFNKLIRG